MKHHLTVKIEKEFKRQLSKRFNPRNARIDKKYCSEKAIKVECSLCKEYLQGYNCGNCPFEQYKKVNEFGALWIFGCMNWIERVMGNKWFDIFNMSPDEISWYREYDKLALELLKKLREKAKKYIVWVENTK